eukprot:5112432-Prymnesium_polylepis.1
MVSAGANLDDRMAHIAERDHLGRRAARARDPMAKSTEHTAAPRQHCTGVCQRNAVQLSARNCSDTDRHLQMARHLLVATIAVTEHAMPCAAPGLQGERTLAHGELLEGRWRQMCKFAVFIPAKNPSTTVRGESAWLTMFERATDA